MTRNDEIECRPGALKVGKRAPVSYDARWKQWYWFCPCCNMIRYTRYGGHQKALQRAKEHIRRWHGPPTCDCPWKVDP